MRLLFALALPLAVVACSDDSQQRLTDVLAQQGIKDIAVTEAEVTATCASGAKAKADAAELERSVFGVKSERIKVVASKLNSKCEELDIEKRRIDGAKAQIAEQAKALGLDVATMDDATAKNLICDKLTAGLPMRASDRAEQDAANQRKWGCAPAPAIAELPTGGWQIENPPPVGKKPATAYARLQNDAGDRLTVRCAAKKADFYLQTQDPVKKGTKTVDVKIGNAKPAKWKVKPSTDGKAIFFVDLKPAFKALDTQDVATFTVPGPKKVDNAAFKTKGLGEALKKLPKGCQ